MTRIIENKGQFFLSQFEEFKNDLPDNVFMNKVTTGSGMTSVALYNNVKYVICVPFKNLIINKKKDCEEKGVKMLGVYAVNEGGASVADIQKFDGNKIMTTWDSLNKVVEGLGSDIKNWKIMIDEAHQLVHAGSFRTNAIEIVLDNYLKFKSFIFGTATPVRDKFQLPQLQNIPQVQIKWDNLQPVTVTYVNYEKDLDKATSLLCIKHLNNQLESNLHIFVNSVKFISKVIRNIKKAGYEPLEQIRIVCADNIRNKEVLNREIGDKYEISSINTKVVKINFYTATSFEGCDIFDSNGKSYVISDGNKEHTKIDILTILPQIIGRIRNSTTKDLVNLWFSSNRFYSHVTEEQFEVTVKKELERANAVVKDFQIVSEKTKEMLLKEAEDDPYLNIRNSELFVNSTAWYSEMNSFETLHKTYYVCKDSKLPTFKRTQKINSIDYNYQEHKKLEIEGLNKIELGKKANFSQLCKEYFLAVENNNKEITDKIEAVHTIIKQAFEELGKKKMIALKLQKGLIEEELIRVNGLKSNDWKIVKLLNLRVGQWISIKEAKEKLKEVYEKLNINKNGKATDLKNWYEVRKQSKRVNTDKIDGFVIININIKIK